MGLEIKRCFVFYYQTMDKQDIRRKILEQRKQLNFELKKNLDKAICERLEIFESFKIAHTIFAYISHLNEVDTRPCIEPHLLEKTFVLPSTKGEHIQLVRLRSFDELKVGEFGIYEPADPTAVHAHEDIQLAIIPGVAFDLNGNRVGYGGGYFDRFLKKINCTTIALAYEFQIVDQVPTEPYDVPVDYIVTERRIITCHKKPIS